MDEHTKINIAKSLIRLNHKISNKDLDKTLQGSRKLIPRPLVVKGKADWERYIRIQTLDTIPESSWKIHFADNNMPCDNNISFLQCPKCGKETSSGQMKVTRSDLDIKHKCVFCKKNIAGENWICKCNAAWHVCEVHRHCPTKHKTDTVIGPGLPTSSKKVHRPSHTYAEIVDNETKKAKNTDKRDKDQRKADVMPGGNVSCMKRPRRLGPLLQRRFGGGLAKI